MPIMHVPTGPVEVSDPNNVPELFVNGPFNIMNLGTMVQITFTTVRPDIGEVIAGNSTPKFRGIVASRILVPIEMARELVRILGQNLASPGPAEGRA
jgi:hypothetical protein